jgi:transmembrane sensor
MKPERITHQGSLDRSRDRRREEAARWFVTLQHAELSGRVLQSWKKWEAVPENRDAFDAVERVWHLTGSVSNLPAASAQERADDCYDGSVSVASWSKRAAELCRPRKRGLLFGALGLAAAVAAAVVGLLFGFLKTFPEYLESTLSPVRTVAVETGLAEHKEIVFEDGSRIHLGAQSSVTAHFTRSARSVVLDRGEALFSVAHDPNRPFHVNAGGGIITAIGTAFNVRRRQDNDVVVTVTDGIVEITPVEITPPDTISTVDEPAPVKFDEHLAARRIVRGQEVTYDARGKISPVRLSQTNVSTTWPDGRLKYLGEPLRHVIEDVNRYSSRQVILEDPAAGTLLYSGTVFARDINDWIAGLERIYPEIEVITTDDGRVLIRTRPQK